MDTNFYKNNILNLNFNNKNNATRTFFYCSICYLNVTDKTV